MPDAELRVEVLDLEQGVAVLADEGVLDTPAATPGPVAELLDRRRRACRATSRRPGTPVQDVHPHGLVTEENPRLGCLGQLSRRDVGRRGRPALAVMDLSLSSAPKDNAAHTAIPVTHQGSRGHDGERLPNARATLFEHAATSPSRDRRAGLTAISRNCGLAIFPFAVDGEPSRMCTERGTMYFGRCRRQTPAPRSGVDGGPGPRHGEEDDHLSRLVVRDADRGGGDELLHPERRRFDLLAGDAVSPRLDEVVPAIDDEDVPVVVDDGQVPGPQTLRT